jgi:hypothetical protein
MTGLSVNNELERMWKKEVNAHVKLLTRHGPGIVRKAGRVSVRMSNVLVEI